MSTALEFTLITPTPLLLVSKDINAEIQDLLRRLRLIWHDMLESNKHIDRVVSPYPTFLDICSRSRFVLHRRLDVTYLFLKGIPKCLSPYIRNVVIPQQRGFGRSLLDAWDSWDNKCEFMESLEESCTSLNSIALEVPSVIQGGQFVVESATRFLVRYLVEEKVSSVYFVQRELSEENPHDVVIFDTLEKFSDRVNKLEAAEEDPWTKIFPKVFDIVEESGDSLAEWNNIGFERALRVTRYAQTELGLPTYTRRARKH